MTCPICGAALLTGRIRVWKSPWRFVLNWMQSHLRAYFLSGSGLAVLLLKFPSERSSSFCVKCHAVVVAPRVGAHATAERTTQSTG
jgi:hypothetical protein